ncbi:MAG TPA: hypothetical protein DD732_08730 [Rhizobiales bacterium]|jgi:ElaB/YqjD/DUF883 family membrane-anchored ribosome-binding protein|nr:hypothetical protein [Hyphomicrobiales bacterium]
MSRRRNTRQKRGKEEDMASNDAEMPSHQALSEEIREIAKHLATLRRDVEGLTGQLKRSGEHQIERAQDKASEAVTAVETAVRRDPVTALGIALGLGLLLGIAIRR